MMSLRSAAQALGLLSVIVLLGGCTDPDGARRSLAAAGYRDIKITGVGFFGCADNDTFRTRFEAIGVNGAQVSGVVCRGLLKGSTIRTW